MLKTLLAIATLALCGLTVPCAEAAPGELDSGFGDGGIRYTDLPGPPNTEDYAADLAVDRFGRVVVVGRSERNDQTESDAVVARYAVSGTLDPSFGGGDGIVSFHFGSGSFDHLAGVAIDGGGRILVAGGTESDISCTSYCYPVIARLTESGGFDSTFSGDGIETVVADHGGARGVAIDSEDRIVVAAGPAVYRFTESGTPDSGFGTAGRASVEAFSGLAIDGIGRIVVANDYSAKRLLGDGQPDSLFGLGGTAPLAIDPGSSDFVYAVAVDSADRVLVSGISSHAGASADRPFVVRYTPSGELDPDFGEGGIVLGADDGLITDVTVDAAGRYLAVGYSEELDENGYLLIRYLSDGSLDPAFGGGDGFAPVPFFADDVTSDASERIVVSGVGGEEGGDEIDFAVARYLGDAGSGGSDETSAGGGLPSAVAAAASPGSASPAPSGKPRSGQPKKCGKGFRKKRVRGKARCVRKKAARHGKGRG